MKPFIFLLFLTLTSCSQWWEYTTIYEILPYSFKDSDGDGVGDLKGITSKLDYIKDLGIESIHLTPIYASTFLDMGYDITDYYKIDSKFGTMDDFDELVKELKKRDMKLIMDLVINHSSYKHEWFQKSVARKDPYTDFYVWQGYKGYDDNGDPIPPNNWVSVFGGSAWKWNETRNQFYLHQFLEEQPDFNLYNDHVKKEIKKIIKFWLDKGVNGFRLDAVIFFIEDKWLRDDNNQLRQYNQPETYKLIHELRSFLDHYNEEHGGPERILIAEAHTIDTYVRVCYGNPDFSLAHYPYNFILEYIFEELDAISFKNIVQSWIKALPLHTVSLWMTQDHDGKRVGSRIRPEYSDILTMTSMMLPGAVGIYYGQEIAMLNGEVQPDQIKDISGGGARDPTRLIMQWDDSLNAGFTTSKEPYLPPNDDYPTRNVELQKKEKISHYHMFKDLQFLRKTDVFRYGDFKAHVPSVEIFISTRSYKNAALVVVVNFGHSESSVKMDGILSEKRVQYASVSAASINAAYQKGFEFDDELLKKFEMAPLSSIVLSVVYWIDPSIVPPNSNTEQTITNEDGTTTKVTAKNGIIKVDDKVVHVSSTPSTKFNIKNNKVCVKNVPVYDLVKKSVITSETTTDKQSFRIEVDDDVEVNNMKVYTGGYYQPKVIIKDNKIFADSKLVFELFPIDAASPIFGASPNTPVNHAKEMEYVLVLNDGTTTITLSDGIVKVNENSFKYNSPNSMPEISVSGTKISIDMVPLKRFMAQNPSTNSSKTNAKTTTPKTGTSKDTNVRPQMYGIYYKP